VRGREQVSWPRTRALPRALTAARHPLAFFGFGVGTLAAAAGFLAAAFGAAAGAPVPPPAMPAFSKALSTSFFSAS